MKNMNEIVFYNFPRDIWIMTQSFPIPRLVRIILNDVPRSVVISHFQCLLHHPTMLIVPVIPLSSMHKQIDLQRNIDAAHLDTNLTHDGLNFLGDLLV